MVKLSNVVKNGVVKETKYNKLLVKVDNIDTAGFVLKTKYEKDVSDLEKKKSDVDKKIPDVSGLVKKTNFSSKITEVEGKTSSISGLATSSALTAVENKIPSVSNLVTKTDYHTKISDIEKKIADHNHDKYVTLPELNRLTKENFKARLAQENLITKTDPDTELKKISDRVTSNKTKHLLVENELKKLKTFDSSYFKGKSHFEEDVTQNYLGFQPMQRYFKRIAGVGSGNYIYFWKSKGLSDERLNSNTASNYSITPELSYYGTKTRVEFNGSCLKQDEFTYNPGTIVNIYIVYEISKNYNISSYPALENCLFGAVSLTKRVDIDQYKYSGYGNGFDRKGEFTFGSGYGRNVMIFEADLTNETNKKFCLSFHYVSYNDFLDILSSRRNASAPGLNGISYKVYKKCPRISKFLFKIFQTCFKRCEILIQWRSAQEIYIPKVSSPSENKLSDFCPIAF